MAINVGSTVCLRFVYGPAGIKKKTYDLIRIYRLPQKLSKFSLQNITKLCFLWSCPWFARGLSMVCPWRGCQLISLSQWLNFKLSGITCLVGKIKFILFSQGSIG